MYAPCEACSELWEDDLVEGFWLVQYEGLKDNGGGVAMLMKGRVFGGDSGYTYTGEYQTQGDSIRVHIMVRNFLAGVPSVLGVIGDFELDIVGTLRGNVITAKGSLTKGQAAGIALKLTKRADLPA